MKTITILVLLGASAWGQKFNSAPTGKFDATGLNLPLPNGTSDPGTCTVGNLYVRTDTQALKICTSANTWSTVSGGGGTSSVLTSVNSGTFTATPSYSVSTSTIQGFTMPTLTGNVTSQTLTTTSATSGQLMFWVYTQNGTGGFTVVHPTNLLNACAPDTGAGKITIITAVWNGTNALATGCATDANGFLIPQTAFSTYPTCAAGTAGMVGSITDSSTTTQGATVTGGGSGKILMYCNGTNWLVTSGSGGGGGGVSSASQTIGFATVAAGGANPSVEVALTSFAGISGSTRFFKATFQEATQFSCGAATALTVSMGRTGANDSEMTGLLPLMQTSGNFYTLVPPEPQLTSTYSLFLNFASTGVNVSACTAGSLVVTILYQ